MTHFRSEQRAGCVGSREPWGSAALGLAGGTPGGTQAGNDHRGDGGAAPAEQPGAVRILDCFQIGVVVSHVNLLRFLGISRRSTWRTCKPSILVSATFADLM